MSTLRDNVSMKILGFLFHLVPKFSVQDYAGMSYTKFNLAIFDLIQQFSAILDTI